MPVQETADAIAELDEAQLPVGSVIVNMAAEPLLPAASLDRAAEGRLTGADLAPALAAAHIGDGALADALAREAVEHAQTWAAQDALRGRIEALDRPTVELPLLVGPIDLGALFELAGRLEEHLAVGVAA
jgi:hypothetical protein